MPQEPYYHEEIHDCGYALVEHLEAGLRRYRLSLYTVAFGRLLLLAAVWGSLVAIAAFRSPALIYLAIGGLVFVAYLEAFEILMKLRRARIVIERARAESGPSTFRG